MVFVDTSAIYAFLASDDVGHSAAVAAWKCFMDEATPLFTSNYVVVESCALLQKRLGIGAVRSLLDALLPAIEVQWVTNEAYEFFLRVLGTGQKMQVY